MGDAMSSISIDAKLYQKSKETKMKNSFYMKTSAFHYLLLSMHDVYEESQKKLKVSFT